MLLHRVREPCKTAAVAATAVEPHLARINDLRRASLPHFIKNLPFINPIIVDSESADRLGPSSHLVGIEITIAIAVRNWLCFDLFSSRRGDNELNSQKSGFKKAHQTKRAGWKIGWWHNLLRNGCQSGIHINEHVTLGSVCRNANLSLSLTGLKQIARSISHHNMPTASSRGRAVSCGGGRIGVSRDAGTSDGSDAILTLLNGDHIQWWNPLTRTISLCPAQHYTRKLDVYSRKNRIGSQIDRPNATHQHQRWYSGMDRRRRVKRHWDQSIRYTSRDENLSRPPTPPRPFELFDRSVVLCYCTFCKICSDHMLIILIITVLPVDGWWTFTFRFRFSFSVTSVARAIIDFTK